MTASDLLKILGKWAYRLSVLWLLSSLVNETMTNKYTLENMQRSLITIESNSFQH